MPVDQVNTAGEVISYRPSAVGRAADMPEAAAVGCLSRDRHFAGPEVYDCQPGGLLPCTGGTPGRLLTGIRPVDGCAGSSRAAGAGYLTVSHDRHRHFV